MGRFVRLLLTTACVLSALHSSLLAQEDARLAIGPGGIVSAPPARTFATIARGDSSSIARLSAVVINSHEEWLALLPAFSDRNDEGMRRPPVDFATQTIVAIFQGDRGRGGRGISVQEIVDHPSHLVISTFELVPRPNCTGVTRRSPYEVVVLPKTSKRVEIDTFMEFVDCSN